MATPANSDVRTLFNGKACSWQSKYGSGGRLEPRIGLFADQLSRLCPLPASILDFGCGTGEIASAICRMGYQVTACDIAENMLEVARSHWMGIPVEWLSLRPGWSVLPFKDQSFDGIVSSSVFEYLINVERVVWELGRVLRPGGVMIFTVPNPCNRIRKIEKWLRSGFLPRAVLPLFGSIRGVNSYLTYLRLSRIRLAGVSWKPLLNAAGFEAVNWHDFSEACWREKSEATLVLLSVKKAAVS